MNSLTKVLWSKIHRATVTHADVHYEGSVTIPPELLAASDIHEYEAVCVWNVTNGQRFETYAITGRAGSSDICINGAAAHLAKPGHLVIIACFHFIEAAKRASYRPKLVFVDGNNKILPARAEVAGPELPTGMTLVS